MLGLIQPQHRKYTRRQLSEQDGKSGRPLGIPVWLCPASQIKAWAPLTGRVTRGYKAGRVSTEETPLPLKGVREDSSTGHKATDTAASGKQGRKCRQPSTYGHNSGQNFCC